MDKDLLQRTKIFTENEDDEVTPIDEDDQKALVEGLETENSKTNFLYKIVFTVISFFFCAMFFIFSITSIFHHPLFEFQSLFSYLGSFSGYAMLMSCCAFGFTGLYVLKYQQKDDTFIQLSTALGIPPFIFWIFTFAKFPQFPTMYLWLPLGSLGYSWAVKMAVNSLRGTEKEIQELSSKIYHYKNA